MNRFFSQYPVDSFLWNGTINVPLMRTIFYFVLVLNLLCGPSPAATPMVPGAELSFNGTSFQYTRVRFDSATGESGASASLDGDALTVAFGSFGGAATPADFSSDYGTAHIGLRIHAVDSLIADLTIVARGTYSVSAAVSGSWASFSGSIPFSMQLFGVNGVRYTSADLSRSYSLNLNPSSVTLDFPGPALDQNNQTIPASGTWTAQWSITGIASTLADVFQLGAGQNITQLDVAVTPDISTAAGDTGSGTVTMDQIKFTPTPEPSSLTLIALTGLAFLAARRRKS